MSNRNLVGLGIRFKLISSPILNMYLGNSYLYEFEGIDKYDTEDYYHRNSTYLSFTANFPKSKLGIINTCYFHPLYNNLEDYRILEEFKLDYKVNKYISFFSKFNYYRDNITPNPDAKAQFSSSTQFGLGISI